MINLFEKCVVPPVSGREVKPGFQPLQRGVRYADGHTVRVPEGHEGRSQGCPKGKKSARRAAN